MGAHDEMEDWHEEQRRAREPQPLPVPETLQAIFDRHKGKTVIFLVGPMENPLRERGILEALVPPQRHFDGRITEGTLQIRATFGDKKKFSSLYFVTEDRFEAPEAKL